jgi:tRNA (mo5U34)-methyltransferase
MHDAETQALAKTWFYPFRLPSGGTTPTYGTGELDAIHHTRSAMLETALQAEFGSERSALSAVDLACHQGWFSAQLAQSGFGRVIGVDARPEHIADAGLIRDALRLPQIELVERDVHAVTAQDLGTHDLVLCFGLIYHLENPVGALRVARALSKRLCIDETGETHGPEASTTGICLVPSVEALVWIMDRIGFRRVEVLPVPEDGYEQLVHRKRVMVAGWV